MADEQQQRPRPVDVYRPPVNLGETISDVDSMLKDILRGKNYDKDRVRAVVQLGNLQARHIASHIAIRKQAIAEIRNPVFIDGQVIPESPSANGKAVEETTAQE